MGTGEKLETGWALGILVLSTFHLLLVTLPDIFPLLPQSFLQLILLFFHLSSTKIGAEMK
jgi:hypothetical protein